METLVETTVVVVVVVVGVVTVVRTVRGTTIVSVVVVVVEVSVEMILVAVAPVVVMVEVELMTMVEVDVGVGMLRHLQAVEMADLAKVARNGGRPLFCSSRRFLSVMVSEVVVETVITSVATDGWVIVLIAVSVVVVEVIMVDTLKVCY